MTNFCKGLFALLAASLAWAAPARAALENSDCLECHADKTLTKTNAGKAISLFVDEARFRASAHKTNACVGCHAGLKKSHPDDNLAAKPVNCAACHPRQSESYGASVHGLALAAGQAASATCVDCHGVHDVLPPSSPASPLHFSRLAATCGQCHAAVAGDVQQSVHGREVAKGNRDAATCTDCHSEHKIEALKASSSLKIAEQVCSKCHASERLSTKYRLPPDRVKTFFESYHGLAVQYGSTRAANCASCHGVHKILPSSDPRSMIHPNHLVETCGKCHPGATDKFAQGKIHTNGTNAASADIGDVANRWVRRIYLGLIFGTIGFMLAHNGLALGKKIQARRRAQARPILRMNTSQRVQHFTLVVSFVVLAVTGFALRYPDSWIAWVLGGSENLRRWSHRGAGLVMLVAGAYHIAYILFTQEGRQLVKDFLPGKKDVADFFANLGYLCGARPEKARFARFGYPEKMEYWAVVWGTLIMGATGLMIWFKMDVTHWLPRWVVDVATTIHYYEAILACLAIVVWHFYHVMFDPDVYPLNWAWWDGNVSAHWCQEEHPLDPANTALLAAHRPAAEQSPHPVHPVEARATAPKSADPQSKPKVDI
jgi:formate dehydrogenase gamma subunit